MNRYPLPVLLIAASLAACQNTENGEGSPLVSSGESRGTVQSLSLDINDSYAGLLNQLELAVDYDPNTDSFVGRIKNETGVAVCDISIEILLDDWQTASGSSLLIPNLVANGSHSFTIPADAVNFTSWSANIDSFTCLGGNGEGNGEGGSEGSEGSEGGSGNEGAEGGAGAGEGGEGAGHNETGGGEGSEGGSGTGAEESSPATPIDQVYSGTLNSLDFAFAYDASSAAFRGVVENNTSQVVCASRVEIHLGVAAQVVELGPTIGVDLAPGEMVDVVMSVDGLVIDTWTLHPESSPCGSTAPGS